MMSASSISRDYSFSVVSHSASPNLAGLPNLGLARTRLFKAVVFGIVLISTDGIAQALDSDVDGVPDTVELAEHTDPDNAANFLDSDGDGVPDYADDDSDGDNVLDVTEVGGNPYVDADLDGVPGYLDDDDSNAAIGDVDGAVSALFDPQGSGRAAFQNNTHDHKTDSDGDKVPDSTEIAEGTSPYDASSFIDSDNDSIPDIIDADSDGDGLWNELEHGRLPYYDRDCDGVPAYLDDNDFIWSVSNNNGAVESLFDPDKNGVASFQDAAVSNRVIDTDNDGVPDGVELIEDSSPTDNTDFIDSDNDSVPDFLDEDDDNDSILDVVEGTGDADGDLIPNYLDTDSDQDGIPDSVEGIADADGDSVPNFLDPVTQIQDQILDQDNDGLSDLIEGTGDWDKDGIANLLDTDSDNDLIPDSIESNSDLDGDGQPNYLDLDSDGDTIPDLVEGQVDTDGDLRANYVDLDSDADGIPDSLELTDDVDGDGIPNYLDTDSDGDNIPDLVETTIDTDFDGIADFLDNDSDGDGLSDLEEQVEDLDFDGIPAFLDVDDNNAEVNLPTPAGRVQLGGSGCVATASGLKDPLFLIMLTACMAGMFRRRKATDRS